MKTRVFARKRIPLIAAAGALALGLIVSSVGVSLAADEAAGTAPSTQTNDQGMQKDQGMHKGKAKAKHKAKAKKKHMKKKEAAPAPSSESGK